MNDWSKDLRVAVRLLLTLGAVTTAACSSTQVGGSAGHGGASSGSAHAGGGGAGGEAAQGGCLPSCTGFSEGECAEASSDGNCKPIYGEPLGSSDSPRYAGCRTACCDARDCDGAVDAEVCARPPDEPGVCWAFNSGAIPDGWIILSEVEPCESIAECVP